MLWKHWKNREIPEHWLSHDRSIRAYLWSHRALKIVSSVVGLYFVFNLLFSQPGRVLEEWLAGVVTWPLLLWLSYFALVGLVWEIISFPFSVAHHYVERRFGLSKQSYFSLIWDWVKGLLLGGVLGAVALSLLYVSQMLSMNIWWLLAACLMILFSIILAQLTPVVLIPLFFKLKPMAESEIKNRLLGLCSRFGIPVKEVYHLGLGEKTEKGNAAFTGLGKTKRILIGDTLYERYSPEQIEAIFAHELGHQVHNDLWKGIGFSSYLVLVSFFLSWWLCDSYLWDYFLTEASSAFGLLVYFSVFSVLQFPLGFFQVLWSRHRENLADQFAAHKIGLGESLASALERLTLQNYALFCPNPWWEFLTYSHPAPWRRIMGLVGLKEKRVGITHSPV